MVLTASTVFGAKTDEVMKKAQHTAKTLFINTVFFFIKHLSKSFLVQLKADDKSL